MKAVVVAGWGWRNPGRLRLNGRGPTAPTVRRDMQCPPAKPIRLLHTPRMDQHTDFIGPAGCGWSGAPTWDAAARYYQV